jgi:hypothetical protein
MDCEKFERVLMDHLYGELDELTRAGASRHADQCRRCKQLWLGLRATREVGSLPLDEPRDNFETRVMDSERQAQVGLPLAVRLSRKLTIVAGYAMRHELAMAALALLMIGSSLLLLRPRPGSHASSAPSVPDGAPLPEPEEVVIPVDEKQGDDGDEPEAPAAEEAAQMAPIASAAQTAKARLETAPSVSAPSSEEELDLARARAEDRSYASAMNAFRGSDYSNAQQQFDAIVESGGRNAGAAELYAALSAEQALGCSGAVPRFDSVAAKYPAGDLGHMATWHSAVCRTELGHDRRALLDFQKLLKVPAYAARARKALGLVGTESAADASRDPALAGSVDPAAAASAAAASAGDPVPPAGDSMPAASPPQSAGPSADSPPIAGTTEGAGTPASAVPPPVNRARPGRGATKPAPAGGATPKRAAPESKQKAPSSAAPKDKPRKAPRAVAPPKRSTPKP